MWDRIRIGRTPAGRPGVGAGARAGRHSARQPVVESLEERQLMTASLAPISNLTVPTQQGYTLPLNGSGTTDAQTFTVTSSNPDIPVNIVSGPFWTVNVDYPGTSSPNPPSNPFTGSLTFQLFNSAGSTTLTPNTVSHIEQFTNDGYYTNTGKYITRVATGFPGATDYVVQGGAPNPDGSGNSGQPNTPFANENVQQLAFSGTDQLAMANSGGTNSNDTQFFITTGSPNNELGYNYSIFGQLVSGQTTLTQLTQIPTKTNSSLGNEKSLPYSSPTFMSVTLSNTNPNGVALIDTTQAKAGETSTITVTATDPTDGTKVTQSFTVTVGSYLGPTSPAINFRPFANPVTVTAPQGKSTKVTLSGSSGYPNSSQPATLSYALVSQPAHGTITNFNPTTGTFNYTPSPGFAGTDTFQYQVNSSGPQATPATTTSNPAAITITVSPSPPVNTGAVRVVGTVLIVTPLPHVGHRVNVIDVVQTPSTSTSSTPVIQVFVNGQLDINQPQVSAIDSIIVFGSKTSDRITIDPSVTIPALVDGGHGGRNVLKGGGAETREHGWFGLNKLVGGTGPNELIGRAGHVKFKPSSTTTLIFAGTPGRAPNVPPSGTFYVYQKGRLIPVPLSNLYPHAIKTGKTHGGTHKKK
jgi:cyclophilin family peptidyl-prolyl cis-trans isomerase